MKNKENSKLTWDSVSLKTFCEIQSILTDETLDNEEQIVDIISLLYGVNILNLPISQSKQYINNVYKLLTTDIKESLVYDKYVIHDTEYYFQKDMGKITTLQFIDCTGYIQEDRSINNYNKILSVFLIPVNHEYSDGYDIEKTQSDIDNFLSVVDAISIATFFLRYWKRYIKLSQKYLIWEIMKMKKLSWKEKKQMINQLNQAGDFFHCF